MSKPIIYFSSSADGGPNFHLSAHKYETNSDHWEANNIELKAKWFGTEEATFNTLSNIFAQAGIILLKD